MSLISRHISLTYWAICLSMLQPCSVWWVAERVPVGFTVAPFFSAQVGSQYKNIWYSNVGRLEKRPNSHRRTQLGTSTLLCHCVPDAYCISLRCQISRLGLSIRRFGGKNAKGRHHRIAHRTVPGMIRPQWPETLSLALVSNVSFIMLLRWLLS